MFVCTIENNVTYATVLEGYGEHICRIPIGYDDTTGSVYSAAAALSPLPGMGPRFFEFVFWIQEIGIDNSEPYRYFDGLRTRFIESSKDRRLVLEAILAATDSLIDTVRPAVVTMYTYEKDLPEKALRKYELIAEQLRNKGYSGGRSDSYHGQQAWQLWVQH